MKGKTTKLESKKWDEIKWHKAEKIKSKAIKQIILLEKKFKIIKKYLLCTRKIVCVYLPMVTRNIYSSVGHSQGVSLPLPVSSSFYKSLVQSFQKFGLGPTIAVETSCVFLLTHWSFPIVELGPWNPNPYSPHSFYQTTISLTFDNCDIPILQFPSLPPTSLMCWFIFVIMNKDFILIIETIVMMEERH